MKKSIKSIVLGLVTVGLLTGCFGEGTTSSSDSQVSSSNSTSNITSDSSLTSSSTTSSLTSSISSSSTSSIPSSTSSSSSSTSSIVVLTQITLTAPKTTLEINEEVLISSNVEGVTLTTTEGATITNNVFKATKDGTYVVTAHKDGDFIDGTLEITVLEAKQDIVLAAEKTNLDLNESVTITSNVEGVTLTTTEGATIENGVFTASKEGTYVVTGTKEGRYNDGTLTISVAFAQTEAKVKAAIQTLKDTENYTLKGHNLIGDYAMYRTPDYFFDTERQEGMALFTNIIPGTQFEKVAHYIKMVDNKLVIGNDVVYNINGGTIATDLYDVDGFHFVDLDKVTFEEHNGKFVTTDENLLGYFGNVLGTQAVAFASAVQYSFNDKYELVANILFAKDDDSINYDDTSYFGDLTYTNVGQTVAPVLDEQYKAVTVANEGMSEEVASSFMLKQAHIKTTIKIVTGETEQLLGTSEYNFDEKYLVEDKFIANSNKTIHNLYTNDNGTAKYVGVGPDNQISTSYYGDWDSFTFPFASLNTTQFRQTGEHTYSYLGFESHDVACNLAWASIGDNNIAYITATEENGKIVSFTCETSNALVNVSPDDDNPEFVVQKVVMEVEVLPYETIEDPKPFEADADTTRVKAYLDELNGANANFTMFMGDYANTSNYKTIKVTEDTILVQKYENSATTYTGYHKLSDGGIIKFSATNDNGEANAKFEGDVELAEGKTFASLLGLNIAPETMTFDVDGNIVFKDNVFNCGNGLFNEFKYRLSAIDNTILFKVSSGHITGITYNYGTGTTPVEYTMNYGYGTTALTSAFETKLLEVLPTLKGAPTPTSWAEEMPEFYDRIVSMVGEDNAALVPYIYDIAYSGKFALGSNTATLKSVKLTDNINFTSEYRAAISAACVANGFTQNPNNANSCYIDIGEMRLTVGTTGTMFTVMYKANA